MSSARATTTSRFQADVIDASREVPVLVDFWAPWCGPCRALGPVLEQLAAEVGERVRVVKVNTDEEPELGSRFAIRSIPAVKLFRDGRVVDEFVGAQPLGAVRTFVDPHLPRPSAAAYQAALALAAAGRLVDARNALLQVVSSDPDNVAAIIDLARLEALDGDPVGARARLQQLPPRAQSEPATRAAYATIHFATLAQPSGGLDPDSNRARAARAMLGDSVDSAVESLLSEMATTRSYAVGAGKTDLLEAFALVGPDDSRVPGWRRRLAALVH